MATLGVNHKSEGPFNEAGETVLFFQLFCGFADGRSLVGIDLR